MRRADLTGKTFGLLKVIELAYIDENRCRVWRCACRCGGEKLVKTTYLTQESVKSCGCLNTSEARAARAAKQKRRDSSAPGASRAGTPGRRTMEQTNPERMKHPDNTKCGTCIYREAVSLQAEGKPLYCCGYLNLTRQRRPCRGGKDCTAYRPRKRGQQPPKAPVGYF